MYVQMCQLCSLSEFLYPRSLTPEDEAKLSCDHSSLHSFISCGTESLEIMHESYFSCCCGNLYSKWHVAYPSEQFKVNVFNLRVWCFCDRAWMESPWVCTTPTVYFVKAEHFAALYIFQRGSSERDPTMKSSLPQEETLTQVKELKLVIFFKRDYSWFSFSRSLLHLHRAV